jgi:hypothetical protein
MKKHLVIGALSVMVGGLAFVGCAPMVSGAMNASITEADVMSKTAKYFGAKQKDIKVTDIDKGALATNYKTTYKGKLYNCSIYYGQVKCQRPGE